MLSVVDRVSGSVLFCPVDCLVTRGSDDDVIDSKNLRGGGVSE